MRSLGLMSGTSLDGIDAAIITTDGVTVQEIGASLTFPYARETQARMHAMLMEEGDFMALEQELTLAHAEAVFALLEQSKLAPRDIDVIGFHGQTIIHRPDEHITWQLGNGSLLAERTGINVVYDFRRRDMAAGGQGAPLVPLYHAAIVQGQDLPVAVLNIGGVANVTWIGKEKNNILAFDTGPGNAMLNDWILDHTGALYDKNGEIAAQGKVDDTIVRKFLLHPYFAKPAPKSLDRNSFDSELVTGLSVEDGAATLTAFTIESITKARDYFPEKPNIWFVAGGGRHNATMMKGLQQKLNVPVHSIDDIGYDGDSLEAQAFAYLAVRSVEGLPLTLPTTTGVKHPVTGGVFCRA